MLHLLLVPSSDGKAALETLTEVVLKMNLVIYSYDVAIYHVVNPPAWSPTCLFFVYRTGVQYYGQRLDRLYKSERPFIYIWTRNEPVLDQIKQKLERNLKG